MPMVVVGEAYKMIPKDPSKYSKEDTKKLETNSKALLFLRMSIPNTIIPPTCFEPLSLASTSTSLLVVFLTYVSIALSYSIMLFDYNKEQNKI